LTGPDDLPSCAALALCDGTAVVVVARAEDAYQQLHDSGLAKGTQLQLAANLLPIATLAISESLFRYRGLKFHLETSMGALGEEVYGALYILTFLDHPPKRIIEWLFTVNGELDLVNPDSRGPVNLLIAADLTFLDLVRQDHYHQPILEPHAIARMIDALHAFHVASEVLVSQVETASILPTKGLDSLAWPKPFA